MVLIFYIKSIFERNLTTEYTLAASCHGEAIGFLGINGNATVAAKMICYQNKRDCALTFTIYFATRGVARLKVCHSLRRATPRVVDKSSIFLAIFI